MIKLNKHIWLSKDFPREKFLFLMDCKGVKTASKMLTRIVVDYTDLEYNNKRLSRENKLLKQQLKSIEK